MQPAAALIVIASATLLLTSKRQAVGVVEAPDDEAGISLGLDLGAAAESFMNRLTDTGSTVPADVAAANVVAFLGMLRMAEGTASQPDPYRVTYGYSHIIQNLADHPTVTGEWGGLVLPDAMCARAGFGPGCKSTAAGAYQIIKPTWIQLRNRLSLRDFSPASQDAAAIELIRRRGALSAVESGDLVEAVRRCRNEWASLPGNYAGQGQRTYTALAAAYTDNGGTLA